MATWEHCAGCVQMAAVGSALPYVLLLPRAATLKSCSGCGPTAGLGGTETRARPRREAATWRSCNMYWPMGAPGTSLASAEPLRQPAMSSSCSGCTRTTASPYPASSITALHNGCRSWQAPVPSAASYPPQKGQTLIDGAASSLVERAAGTGLGRKLWSSQA